MRQAGRYLPEYREVRREAGDFLTMCHTPEIAAEVTLQPIRRFGLDAAIVFSDILTPLVPMGAELTFTPAPHIANPVRTPDDLDRLRIPEPWSGTEYLSKTLERVRDSLEDVTALIGFCGAPWTLASYLVEGGTSKSFTKLKSFAHHHPEEFDRLVDLLADAMAAYLKTQVEHGAQAVQIFDSWVGALAADEQTLGCPGSTLPTAAPTCCTISRSCRARSSGSTGESTCKARPAPCPTMHFRATWIPVS
jgi:uroporphyrinogen decarboxylase